MKRYVDVDAFIKNRRSLYCFDCDRRKNSKGKIVYEIGEAPCRACDTQNILDDLEDAPTADVQEVRRGKWIMKDGYITCNNCECKPYSNSMHIDFDNLWKHCPSCGANMRN